MAHRSLAPPKKRRLRRSPVSNPTQRSSFFGSPWLWRWLSLFPSRERGRVRVRAAARLTSSRRTRPEARSLWLSRTYERPAFVDQAGSLEDHQDAAWLRGVDHEPCRKGCSLFYDDGAIRF